MLIACRLHPNILRDDQKVSWRNQAWLLKNSFPRNPQNKIALGSVDVIYNRLFIADEVKKLNVLKRWEDTIDLLRRSRNIDGFGKSMDQIMDDIRRAALKDLK